MGYYTDFTLTYELPEQKQGESVKKFIADCRKKKVAVPTDIQTTFDESLSLEIELEMEFDESTPSGYGAWKHFINGDADQLKWYDWDTDMRCLSNKFPTVTFTLKGEGEESGDLWIAYYLGGKGYCDKAEVVFPEYSEKKLK